MVAGERKFRWKDRSGGQAAALVTAGQASKALARAFGTGRWVLPNDFRLTGVRRFLGSGAWAVADQGFSALASFAINLVLIRWLALEQYGAFAVSFSWFLLLSGVQNSLLLEPLLVFGAGRYNDVRPAYLRTLAFGHWPLSAALSGLLLLIGAAAWSLGSAVLGTAFAGAALSASGMMFLQFARRTCYLRSNLRPAAISGAIYLLVTPLSAFALSRVNLLSPFAVYLLMGFASFAIGACLLYRQGIPVAGGNHLLSLGPVARDHWDYGRWVIASTLAAWVPGNLYSLVLPVMVSLEAAGVLAALMLFVRPVMTVVQPLALMMVSGLVRMNRNGYDTLHRMMAGAFLFLVGAIIYWAFVAFGRRPLVESILGTQYGPYSFLLLILGGVAPAMAAASVFASGLRAAMRPDLEFQAHLLSVMVAVAIGLPLVTVLNLTGAAIGLTTSYAALAAAMMFMLLSKRPVPMLKIEIRQS